MPAFLFGSAGTLPVGFWRLIASRLIGGIENRTGRVPVLLVLGRGAVALLIFFAAAAGARIVAAHFGSGADRLRLLGCLRGAGLQLHFLLLAALAAFDFLGFVFGTRRLNEE